MKKQFPSYKSIRRAHILLAAGANTISALMSYIYLSFLDPTPTGQNAFDFTGGVSWEVTAAGMIVLLSLGIYFSHRFERYHPQWYELMLAGTSPDNLPEAAKREVLNQSLYSALISLGMWLFAGTVFGWILRHSVRAFVGIAVVGGILTVAITFFTMEWFWRSVIPIYFPTGKLSQVKAFRLPVFIRLLLVFSITSLFPSLLLSGLALRRARELLTAGNPQIIIQNLVTTVIFIFVISLALAILLSLAVTRSIVGPLVELQRAMKRIEQNDLTVKVPVVSNDELGYVSERFNEMVGGLRRAELLRNLLNLYVSPEVAREALEHGTHLGGQLVESSVLFSDIRGFTSLSEQLPPEKLIELLNRYMSCMVAAVVTNGGMVNKFGGDSLLAVFGTPLNPNAEHAAAAVRTALAMKSSLAEFNAQQVKTGAPVLQIGIGIASGPVVAGNIGGQDRIEYTVIGDTVNLASRLQDLTKELGRDILASGATVQSAARGLSLAAEPLQAVSVRGKTEQVKVFAIISDL